MRLHQIRLSGFKSFVDPTSIHFPGQLVGIVGPNGCGKSNVIDAVRWVLGETRASALRGDSMQDVIFNGSGNRKPLARASVELLFDNSLGRAGGQWQQYAEISVKRVLQRDGESSYYINNQHVRRRDVTDMFLGTGLGPRAYAIIEQGMISRVIEAKPEELRVFLEEAAGVSRYKERRRETEHRLADTRENLSRVTDIRLELGAQIEKLEAQAQVATRYQALQGELQLKQQLLWFLRRRDAAAERERHAQEIARSGNALEAETASLREVAEQIGTKYSQSHADTPVELTFGASTELASQLRAGAPMDVLMSADEEIPRALEIEGLANDLHTFAGNRLVVVVSAAAAGHVKQPIDLTGAAVKHIAMPLPAVPIGHYAREWVTKKGLLKAVEARLVQTENVRATLAAVDAGNADAAIVYATDARGAASAKVAFEVPASEQPRIVYVALRARDSKHAELAHRFLEFVAGSEGAKLLQDAGFTAPAP